VTPVSGTPLTQNSKPEMRYIGAESCPYCRELRWPLALALNKSGAFTTPLRGTFQRLREHRNPALLPSNWLVLTPVGNEKIDHSPLQVTTTQQALWHRCDPNFYLFIDFGNEYDISGLIYDPQVPQGKNLGPEIASALHRRVHPHRPGLVAAANYISGLVRFQNSAVGLDLGIYAARSYSLMRPPRTDRRLIRSSERSGAGWSGLGGRSWRLRWGRRPL
jgi:hypothetical protein